MLKASLALLLNIILYSALVIAQDSTSAYDLVDVQRINPYFGGDALCNNE